MAVACLRGQVEAAGTFIHGSVAVRRGVGILSKRGADDGDLDATRITGLARADDGE